MTSNRMALTNVTKGAREEPLSIFLYGMPGVGKTSFAEGAPDAVILPTEDRHDHIACAKFPTAGSLDDVNDALTEVERGTHTYRTLVVDTLDHLEELIHAKVLAGTKWKTIADFGGGYGKGPAAAVDQYWRPFLARCFAIRKARKLNLVFISHAKIDTFKDPLGADYHRYAPKLAPGAAALVKELVGYVLFARFESFSKVKEGESRARGFTTDARIIHTQWSAAYDAKNSANLPPELPLGWAPFADAIAANSPAHASARLAELRAELAELIPQLPTHLQASARANAAKDFDVTTLTKIVDGLRGLILTTKEVA